MSVGPVWPVGEKTSNMEDVVYKVYFQRNRFGDQTILDIFSYAYVCGPCRARRGYIFIIEDVVYKVYFQRKVFGGQIILNISLFAYDCGPFSGPEVGYIQLWRTPVIAMKQAKKWSK